MEKSLRKFFLLSTALTAFLFSLSLIFSISYAFLELGRFNFVLLVLMLFTTLAAALLLLAIPFVTNTYRKENVTAACIWIVKFGLDFLLPSVIFLAGLLKGNKDAMRFIYIKVNNAVVQSGGKRFNSRKILLLLPRCLQNSGCRNDITQDISNCQGCGSCSIGGIARIAEEEGIKAMVVSGGTAARNIVKGIKPGLIVAVACERELASAISDVGKIPVIGMVNERPKGPCNNTSVNVEGLKKKMESVITQI